MHTEEVIRELGKNENVRFMAAALCRAVPTATERLQGAATTANIEAAENPNLRKSEPDPMLVGFLDTAIKKSDFFRMTKTPRRLWRRNKLKIV